MFLASVYLERQERYLEVREKNLQVKKALGVQQTFSVALSSGISHKTAATGG